MAVSSRRAGRTGRVRWLAMAVGWAASALLLAVTRLLAGQTASSRGSRAVHQEDEGRSCEAGFPSWRSG